MIELQRILGDRLEDAYVSARSGDYQLLLGAGASLGAKNARGVSIPAAEGLIDMLRSEFPDALIEDGNSLQRAYQRAVQNAGADAVWRFLKKVFGSADHEEWFTQLTEYPWRRVWTLNIDDTFERSFPRGVRARIMGHRSIDWHEEYSESDSLQIIHLHGSIQGPEPSPLIFSFSEYAAAATKRPVWDSMLRGSVSAQPFIILGARGLDDPDLEAILLGNKPQHRAPSIVVNPHITPGQRREFESLGYLIFEGTAETFVHSWSQAMGMERAQLNALYETTAVAIPEFSELRLEHAAVPARNHDFIGGSEPLWNDARVGAIAKFEWIASVSKSAQEWLADRSRKTELHVIFSDRLSGLSSGLFHVARELRAAGATVLHFDRRARFDRRRVIDYCRGRGSVVIICDAAHEFTMYFEELLSDAIAEPNCKILLIFGEKNFHELQVDNHFRSNRVPRHTTSVKRRRTRSDAVQIESLLARRGRLGMLEQLPVAQRRAHFVNRDIFSAMAEVERGKGFRRRLSKEIAGLKEGWHRDLLLMLAIAAYGSHQVGIQEAAFGVRVSTDRLLAEVRDDPSLNAVVEVSDDLVYARQRSNTLDGLFGNGEMDERLASLAGVTRSLSGLATTSSLRERNRAASLVGGLMQAKTLREVFPGANIDEYYSSLYDEFGDWNARYWEQRAINARWEGNWGPAESWASRAVTIKDDPYTRTTLGTILLHKAQVSLEYGDQGWMDLFRRGKVELDEALHQDPGNRVAAVSFLQASLKLLRSCLQYLPNGRFSDEFAAIAAEWSASYASVQLVGSVDDSARRKAAAMVQEYESYMAAKGEAPVGRDRPVRSRGTRDAQRKERRDAGARPGKPAAPRPRAQRADSAPPRSPEELTVGRSSIPAAQTGAEGLGGGDADAGQPHGPERPSRARKRRRR